MIISDHSNQGGKPPRPSVFRCTVGGQKSGSIPDPHQPKQLYILKGHKMKVAKKSGKPFKSKLFINTVKGETINESDPKKREAFTFLEDDSIVNKEQCKIIGE